MSVELPLGYPSTATVGQTGGILFREFTTGIPVLSGDVSDPEYFNNFVSSEPVFPTKPSREPFQEKSTPDTEGISADHQSFTVPFSALGSTSSPPKPEDSYLPPPADDSASSDLITDGYESPVEQATTQAVYTTSSFIPPGLLQEKTEPEDTTGPPFKEVDQDSLSGQGKTQKIFL